ncbi:hypothetical protein EON66_02975 [archaeon]|nr:MAG: hypothetical protein EON66_02975 [archaeon]
MMSAAPLPAPVTQQQQHRSQHEARIVDTDPPVAGCLQLCRVRARVARYIALSVGSANETSLALALLSGVVMLWLFTVESQLADGVEVPPSALAVDMAALLFYCLIWIVDIVAGLASNAVLDGVGISTAALAVAMRYAGADTWPHKQLLWARILRVCATCMFSAFLEFSLRWRVYKVEIHLRHFLSVHGVLRALAQSGIVLGAGGRVRGPEAKYATHTRDEEDSDHASALSEDAELVDFSTNDVSGGDDMHANVHFQLRLRSKGASRSGVHEQSGAEGGACSAVPRAASIQSTHSHSSLRSVSGVTVDGRSAAGNIANRRAQQRPRVLGTELESASDTSPTMSAVIVEALLKLERVFIFLVLTLSASFGVLQCAGLVSLTTARLVPVYC